jgi:protein-S-isoprenylcysteine O-methyltransferase Ste14
MMKKIVARIVVLIGALQVCAAPAFAAAPKWIEKQGKGVFMFNVAIVLVIIGFAGYIWWKKRNGEGGGDEE